MRESTPFRSVPVRLALGSIALTAAALSSCGGGSSEAQSQPTASASNATPPPFPAPAPLPARVPVPAPAPEPAPSPVPAPSSAPSPSPSPSPSPAPPQFQVLGQWEGLEEQPFDVVVLGSDVGSVTALRIGTIGCIENTARAQTGSRLFECPAPANATAESTYFYATVSYSTGAADTRAGPFHTASRTAWEAANGQFYFRSLDAYVLAQTAVNGPVISLNAVSLSSNTGDLPPARYFNELRVSGPGGTLVCPYAGSGWRYQCPGLVPGVYVVDVLREQSQLRVISDRFIVLVTAVGAAPPGPVQPLPQPQPQPPTPVPAPPSCNPATDKGC